MQLLNKKAIVTGANRSIGRAIAAVFAKEGADVVISYRSDEKGAKETLQDIRGYGREGKSFFADFSHTVGVDKFFNEAHAFLGCVDIVVNNAAGYDTQSFLDLDVDTFDHLLKVGVVAPMRLSQLAAKKMIENNIRGSIINISSISGIHPHSHRAAHSAAKASLNMLTKSMALELAPYKIRVNALAAGCTPYDGEVELNYDNIPLKRAGLPEDQAKAALYLASEESSWMTGHIMVLDGGQALLCT